MDAVTSFSFVREIVKKKIKPFSQITGIKIRPMILRLVFCSRLFYFFFSYSPLVNYRLQTNIAPKRRKLMGRQKQVVIKMSYVIFYMYNTKGLSE